MKIAFMKEMNMATISNNLLETILLPILFYRASIKFFSTL